MEQLTHGNIKWTYVKDPTKEDLNYIRQNFNVHPLTICELEQPTLHPKANIHEDYIYLVLRFPEKENDEIIPTEVDFVITKNEIITIQYTTLEVLDEILVNAQKNPEDYFSKDAGYLFYQILQNLSDKVTPLLDEISNKIDKLEKRIYLNEEKGLLKDIAFIRRDSNDFLSIIRPNTDVFEGSMEKMTELFSPEIIPYLGHLKSTYTRLTRVAETHTATLQMLHETNEAIASHTLNKIIKLLTMFSVIVFPLTLFAGIWGMNTQNMPLVGHLYDFWIVLVLMAIATFIMLILFKLKKWI